jgi:acyl dehydratase
MNSAHTLRKPPSALRFMAGSVLPKRRTDAWPALALALPPMRADDDDLSAYQRLTDLAIGEHLPIAWPQVWGFRLQMALLTGRDFPLPIWSALQVRNRMLQTTALRANAAYARAVRVAGRRRLDKGTEIDLLSTVHDAHGALAWESLTTFYWRGRAGAQVEAPAPNAASPQVGGDVQACWSSGDGSGWRFGALTGDYNGLHWSDLYARAFGFARAFHHPPRIAGQCLAHLDLDDTAPHQRLDLWFKGPVFYRSELALRAERSGQACRFALQVGPDPRPAVVGQWSVADPGSTL